jgi:hypothetical protein
MLIGIVSFVVLNLCSSCTHAIRRDGYQLNKSNIIKDCGITFLKDVPVDENADSVLGRIKLKDTGFSFACGEDDAIEILKREGCSLGADAIIIISEKRPDFFSSCYRAEAVFVKHKNTGEKFPFADAYQMTDTASVNKRVKADHQRIAGMMVGGIVGGLLGGLLAGLLSSMQ